MGRGFWQTGATHESVSLRKGQKIPQVLDHVGKLQFAIGHVETLQRHE